MWFYKGQKVNQIIDGFEAFVYLIERTNIKEDNKGPIYYLGKKNFYSKRKINGKRVILEQDWQDYYGSSENLLKDIEKYNKSNFKRTILHFVEQREMLDI